MVGAYLLSKTEPETRTTNYDYSGSLLQSKIDAKNQKTQYTYNNYGRMTMIQHCPAVYPFNGIYEDVCQRVTFYYDSDPTGYSHYALGRQTAVEYQGAGCADITPSTQNPVNPNTFVEMYNYSQAGLIVGNKLLVSQKAYQPFPLPSPTVTADLEATYTYDNEGKMTGMTYPSSSVSGFVGDNYTYSFDSLGRPVGMTDQTTMQTAVSGVTYGPAGEMLTVHYGGVNETRTYNTLLQLTALSAYNTVLGQTVLGRQYSYSGTNNNGKIQSETNTLSGEVVTYQYDALNRLIAATSNSATAPWGQSFAYDGFGNLTDKGVTSGSAPTYHATFSAATNRENGPSYDLNGNQTAIPGITLGYNVENRITMATPTGSADVYSYGRGNRRMYAAHWQWNGTKYDLITEKVSFYSVTGQKLGTYQLQLNTSPPGPPSLTFAAVETRVWFGSKLVTLNGGAVTPDRLGSYGTYYPYGEDRGGGNPPADREKFATYTRDSVTGLDYAVNRYYNNVSGRFLSADPYRASSGPADPGSWNRYAYTRGDPVNRMDVTGLDDEPGASTPACYDINGEPEYNPLMCDPGNENYCPGNPYLCHGTTNEPAPATHPPYDTSYGAAKRVMQLAANDIANRDASDYSIKCRDDLNKLGITVGMLAGAAGRVQFFNAIGSTALYSDIYAGGENYAAAKSQYGDQTVGQRASRFKASAYINDVFTTGFARIYINPQAFAPDSSGSQWGYNWSTLMHELVHTLTNLTDTDIQKTLGLTVQDDSGNISGQLKLDCYDQ